MPTLEEMIVLGVTVYFRRDEKGFVYIETDGFRPTDPSYLKLREALKNLQTNDDREYEDVARQMSRHSNRPRL